MPTTFASTIFWVSNWTVTFEAPWTTWAFVRIVPLRSRTKPVPVAWPCWVDGKTSNGDWVWETIVERMKTTPGAAAL